MHPDGPLLYELHQINKLNELCKGSLAFGMVLKAVSGSISQGNHLGGAYLGSCGQCQLDVGVNVIV